MEKRESAAIGIDGDDVLRQEMHPKDPVKLVFDAVPQRPKIHHDAG